VPYDEGAFLVRPLSPPLLRGSQGDVKFMIGAESLRLFADKASYRRPSVPTLLKRLLKNAARSWWFVHRMNRSRCG
jgi:hypothetical protein